MVTSLQTGNNWWTGASPWARCTTVIQPCPHPCMLPKVVYSIPYLPLPCNVFSWPRGQLLYQNMIYELGLTSRNKRRETQAWLLEFISSNMKEENLLCLETVLSCLVDHLSFYITGDLARGNWDLKWREKTDNFSLELEQAVFALLWTSPASLFCPASLTCLF